MKLRVTFKNPDALDEAIDDHIINELDEKQITDDDRIEEYTFERKEELKELARNWFTYGEYVTLEIDIIKQTCVVVNQKLN